MENLGKNSIKMPKVHIKVIIWQSIEVDENQARGIMDGSLPTYDLDGNIEHLFETEHQLTPSQNAEVMATLGELGSAQTLEVWDDFGNILWSNSEQ